MSTIVESVEKVLEHESKHLVQNDRFAQLKESLEELERLGLIKKPTYDLPMTDTVGKRYYEMLASSFKSR